MSQFLLVWVGFFCHLHSWFNVRPGLERLPLHRSRPLLSWFAPTACFLGDVWISNGTTLRLGLVVTVGTVHELVSLGFWRDTNHTLITGRRRPYWVAGYVDRVEVGMRRGNKELKTVARKPKISGWPRARSTTTYLLTSSYHVLFEALFVFVPFLNG